MDRAADRKAKASGESDEEYETGQDRNLEYAEEILDHLLQFSKPTVKAETDDDWVKWRKSWIIRLSKVPHWKLLKIDEFSSPWIENVWEFFDGLRFHGAGTVQTQSHDNFKKNTSLVKEVHKHIFGILYSSKYEFVPSVRYASDPEAYKKEREEWERKRRKIELDNLVLLVKKFPSVGFQVAVAECEERIKRWG